jgi:hypothetical protein
MFKVPRVNIIESDEGFSVEVLGRTGLLYTEGLKKIHIDSEVLASSSTTGLVLFAYSISTWNSPNDSEIINENKRDAIIENIRRAFRFQGVEIEVV